MAIWEPLPPGRNRSFRCASKCSENRSAASTGSNGKTSLSFFKKAQARFFFGTVLFWCQINTNLPLDATSHNFYGRIGAAPGMTTSTGSLIWNCFAMRAAIALPIHRLTGTIHMATLFFFFFCFLHLLEPPNCYSHFRKSNLIARTKRNDEKEVA